ncbi:uncharacterized protein LOC126749172 [Anthonomus grandis grandis]|uniref:uncharacterized protein LOC126749172 n=1 Tax=Anthonomus grandis grandis TaxID=2921223 RepID=UPI0021664047|nr:uncharacterized protein LOC126749172 [Anthonomus grandis grandis]
MAKLNRPLQLHTPYEHGLQRKQAARLARILEMVHANRKSVGAAHLSAVPPKTFRSGRKSYGDSAIGWVQVKRCDKICTVKAKITPEHSVRKKQYAVTCTVDEDVGLYHWLERYNVNVLFVIRGGCKHAIAFLVWLHRRSEEPSPTDVACYWSRSKLSRVGSSVKYLTLKDFGQTQELSSDEESAHFLNELTATGLENNS